MLPRPVLLLVKPNRARNISAVAAIRYLTDLSDFPQSQLKYDLYELMVEEL